MKGLSVLIRGTATGWVRDMIQSTSDRWLARKGRISFLPNCSLAGEATAGLVSFTEALYLHWKWLFTMCCHWIWRNVTTRKKKWLIVLSNWAVLVTSVLLAGQQITQNCWLHFLCWTSQQSFITYGQSEDCLIGISTPGTGLMHFKGHIMESEIFKSSCLWSWFTATNTQPTTI